LEKGIRQPRIAAILHSEIEVLSLGIARGDKLHIRAAVNLAFLCAETLGRGVGPLWALFLAVLLHQHGVVDFATQIMLHGIQVGIVTVRC